MIILSAQAELMPAAFSPAVFSQHLYAPNCYAPALFIQRRQALCRFTFSK
ncbi:MULTISPECIES: hypothetical protein [unclassified Lysobacter]|nr:MULTISPECIES: hypothetical protein [unclassified Lysobacter]MBT2748604.1 hypothetical protein [Lysobacter sp. ISL-42]MBT2751539.1 hypothetical protein [Lysobacter sp. ISL-50]MBT2775733.1 hypothetical protein [Lysobacter sp. ISL-54]MBT2782302.1 hypothetical protein [Lysobacter sp. ISL-52]